MKQNRQYNNASIDSNLRNMPNRDPERQSQRHFVAQVERTIFDLRRGLPVVIHDADRLSLVAAVEALSQDLLDEMCAGAEPPAKLLLTQYRLHHLGLQDAPEAAGIELETQDSKADIVHWSLDSTANLPSGHRLLPADEAERAAVLLARRGRLIPALFKITPADTYAHKIREAVCDNDLLKISTTDIFSHYQGCHHVYAVSEARVPLAPDVDARFVIFRETGSEREQVALLIGDAAEWADPIPVRAHSSCLTGDLFGSLRCDCGSQLRASVAEISKRGGGVLLYLPQRGRGIGLANKMRAYELQDQGLDTIDANRALGFDEDERNFSIAREMLIQLEVFRIDLLTNNPAKLKAMNQAPIQVCNRSSIYGRLTRENRRLLTTKARRGGHWLDPMLSEPVDDSKTNRAGKDS